MKLWFSYSSAGLSLDGPEPPNSPYTITYHLGRFLRNGAHAAGWEFEYRNLDDTTPADIKPDDICVGHTWWDGGFMDQALESKARKFILQPYQHYMVSQGDIPRLKEMFAKADHLLLITGQYWWDTMNDGPFEDWKARATRVDMAVNPDMHPFTKRSFNRPGERRFLCMGVDRPYKGLDMIADTFQMLGAHLGYFGDAPLSRFQHVPRFKHYAGAVMTPERQARIAEEHDFFVSIARGDANPTTLLETACWGMLPLCNEKSGYWPDFPFPGLLTPTDAPKMIDNLEKLEALQWTRESTLLKQAAEVRDHVLKNHTWQKFCETVWKEITK